MDTYTFDLNGAANFGISNPGIPNATLGQPYSHQLAVVNGAPPHAFSIESGTLPPGLTMDAAGLISGTPTAAGTFPAPKIRIDRTSIEAPPITVNDVPPPPPPGDFSLTLVGGWRINQPYCYGGLAIDFATMRAWTCGNRSNNQTGLLQYQLPAMGTGQSVSAWPQVNQSVNYGSPYPQLSGPAWYTYATGFLWKDDLLWISGKQYYAQSPFPDTTIKKFSLSDSTATVVDTLNFSGRKAQFYGGGFIKGGSEVLVGCGGYESGHGTTSGPCWMKLDGTIVNSFPIFNAPKADREKRPDTYSCPSTSEWFVNPDPPVGYLIAGRIFGGGFIANGVTAFVIRHGIGPLAYANQNDYFSVNGVTDTHIYKYAPGSHFGEYEPWPHGFPTGFEVEGNHVYMLIDRAWGDACPAIYCFEVN